MADCFVGRSAVTPTLGTPTSLLLVASYFPASEGWFQDLSNYMTAGQVPYRDFYLFIPPGYPVLFNFIWATANDTIIGMRLYGIAESLVLVGLTYLVIRRLFAQRIAFIAVLTGFVVYTSNVQDVFYGYYQSSLVLAILSLYLAIRCLETFDGGGRVYPVLLGLSSGMLLIFKQSTGLVLPIALVGTLAVLGTRARTGRAVRNATLSGIGFIIPLTITSIVLAANGALGPAIEQIFGGSSSKGSWSELLFGFLARSEAAPTLELLMLILLVAALIQTAGPLRSGGDQQASAIILASWFLAIGVFVVVRRVPITFVDIDLFRAQRQLLIYASFFLMAMYCVNAAFRASRTSTTNQSTKLLVGGTSFVIMYVHGMSGLLEDHAMLLSGALLIGTALSAATAWPRLRDGVIYAVAAVLIFTITVQRNERPYSWWGINNLPATWEATATFNDPLLVGITSSPSYTQQLNAILHIILENERPGDTMYTFPHLNYFNVMSGLPSPTFGKVDFFDVAPDALARLDAQLLRDHSPTFLVWMQLAPAAWLVNEEIFRSGRPSGQRDLQKTYEDLVSSGAYVLLGRYELGDSDPIDIYMRLRAGT